MHIVFLYYFNVQMFCEKLEFTNDQIRKYTYVLANNKFLGTIMEICSSYIHVFPVI